MPGKTTDLLREVAKKYDMYIVLGMPEKDSAKNIYYNSAVLIAPEGDVIGVYHKNSHLIEASWSAIGDGKVPVFKTKYGNMAMLICADIGYSELTLQTCYQNADFLVVPTNGGINLDLLKSRAIEGKCHLLLENRYGNEKEKFREIDYLKLPKC